MSCHSILAHHINQLLGVNPWWDLSHLWQTLLNSFKEHSCGSLLQDLSLLLKRGFQNFSPIEVLPQTGAVLLIWHQKVTMCWEILPDVRSSGYVQNEWCIDKVLLALWLPGLVGAALHWHLVQSEAEDWRDWGSLCWFIFEHCIMLKE